MNDSLAKVKKCLRDENILFLDTDPVTHLRGIAKRRVARKERSAAAPACRRALSATFTASRTKTVHDLRLLMARMNGLPSPETVWMEFAFKITHVTEPIVKQKHSIAGPCRGNIHFGSCIQCHEFMVGVPGYGFRLALASPGLADTPTVLVIGAQAAGTALFEMPADAAMELTEADRETMVETVQQVPYIGKVKVEWRPQRKEFFMVLTEAHRLPNDFEAVPAAAPP